MNFDARKTMRPPTMFFMCFVEGGQSPAYQHVDEDSARAEAERLARVTGRRVWLLEACMFVEKRDVQWNRAPPPREETPF